MSTLKVDTINTSDGSGNITFSRPTVLTAGDIVTADLANDAVTAVKIVDDAVTIAKLAATGTASASTFLRGDNAWAAAGGAWVKIGTQEVTSAVASVTITGLDSTYDTYAICIANLRPVNNDVQCYMRVGDSSGVDSGGSDYIWHSNLSTSASNSYSGVANAGASYIRIGSNAGNVAGEGWGGIYYIHRPGDGTIRPIITGHGCQINGSGMLHTAFVAAARTSVITLDRVNIYFESGNIAAGRMTVWGVSHA